MKRFMFIVAMALAMPFAVQAICAAPVAVSMCQAGDLPDHVVNAVLAELSSETGECFYQLRSEYDSGEMEVESLGNSQFEVARSGGAIISVLVEGI